MGAIIIGVLAVCLIVLGGPLHTVPATLMTLMGLALAGLAMLWELERRD